MSAWVPITSADLSDAKVAALISALQSAALGSSQTDPTPRVIVDVVARIRAEIKGCAKNQLSANITLIPADLHSLGLRMVIRQLQSRLQIGLSQDERDEERNDLDYLRRIAKCEIPVGTPDDPIPGDLQVGPTKPSINGSARQFSLDQEGGL